MMKYKIPGYIWAASTLSMAIGGESLSMEALFLLAVCSVVSGIALWYCYDRHVQQKAQHDLNMKLRRARHSVCRGHRLGQRRTARRDRLYRAGMDRVFAGLAGAVPPARGRKAPKEVGRMPQAVAQSRVIWRHPRGRFDVIETRGTSPLGPPYAIRETVFTPERDKRGQINEPVNNKIFNSGTNKPSKPAKAHREYRPIREKEGVMIMDMYGAGWTITKIAQVLHRDRTKISEYITEQQ